MLTVKFALTHIQKETCAENFTPFQHRVALLFFCPVCSADFVSHSQAMGYQRIEWFLNIGWPCCSLCRKPHRGWGLWCSQTVGIVRRVAGFRGWLAPVGWPSTDNRWWRRNCGGPGRSLVNKGWPRLCLRVAPPVLHGWPIRSIRSIRSVLVSNATTPCEGATSSAS
jgi:hypothetical protein